MENFKLIDEMKCSLGGLTNKINQYHALNYYVTVEIIEKNDIINMNGMYMLKVYREVSE